MLRVLAEESSGGGQGIAGLITAIASAFAVVSGALLTWRLNRKSSSAEDPLAARRAQWDAQLAMSQMQDDNSALLTYIYSEHRAMLAAGLTPQPQPAASYNGPAVNAPTGSRP